MKHTKGPHLLLVNPWIHDFAAYDLWIKPIGLLSLAQLLLKNGYSVSYIDCLDFPSPRRKPYGHGKFHKERLLKPNIFPHILRHFCRYGAPPDHFRQQLLQLSPPEAILVTSIMTYWYPGVIEAIAILKEHFPGVPVILGGNYPTLCPEHAKEHTGADYIISGEGENPVLTLLETLTGHKPTYRPTSWDPDSYPFPAIHLLSDPLFIPLLTSRGCPFSCRYCSTPILSPGYQHISPGLMLREISRWRNDYGIKDFVFYDDALLYKPEDHIIPILEKVCRDLPKCRFHTPNGLHFRYLTPQLCRILKKAGFTTLRFGLDSTRSEWQLHSGGKVTNEDYIQGMSYLREAGFRSEEIGIYIMIGLPGQTADEGKEAIRFIHRVGGTPKPTEYSPVPGTPMWQEALLASAFDLETEPLTHNNTVLPCQSKGFTYQDLQHLKHIARSPQQELNSR